jgi:hypothetical protein
MDYDLTANDEAMRQWGPRLRDDLGISPPESQFLATTLFSELCQIPNLGERPGDETIAFADRFNELACFMNYLGERQAEGDIGLLENRAHLVQSNYICFVYLGESCFLRLRKLTPPASAARKCLKFLTENPIRAFRNAIAHANWLVTDGTVTFWAKKGAEKDDLLCRFTVEDEERRFWFFLSLCVATSSFAALTNSSS